MEVRVQVGAGELMVNSAVGSHVSVGKAGQSLINELYPCFNNIKLRAGDEQIADTLGFLIPHLPAATHTTATSFNLRRGSELWPPIKSADNQGRMTLNTNGTARHGTSLKYWAGWNVLIHRNACDLS